MHEGLLVPVILNGSETMICREKENSRIRPVQLDSLRGLLSIRRMDRVPNVQITKMCGLSKKVDERINESFPLFFSFPAPAI